MACLRPAIPASTLGRCWLAGRKDGTSVARAVQNALDTDDLLNNAVEDHIASVRLGSQPCAKVGTVDAGMRIVDKPGAGRLEIIDEGNGP